MDNNQRVLAYTLAKEISIEEADAVSGGQSETLMTTGPTFKGSATNGSWDTFADLHADW